VKSSNGAIHGSLILYTRPDRARWKPVLRLYEA
jgi:hypothetical protein